MKERLFKFSRNSRLSWHLLSNKTRAEYFIRTPTPHRPWGPWWNFNERGDINEPLKIKLFQIQGLQHQRFFTFLTSLNNINGKPVNIPKQSKYLTQVLGNPRVLFCNCWNIQSTMGPFLRIEKSSNISNTPFKSWYGLWHNLYFFSQFLFQFWQYLTAYSFSIVNMGDFSKEFSLH